MGLEEVKKDIIEKAKSEAEQIKLDASKRVKEIEEASKAKLASLRKEQEEALKQKIEQLDQIRKSDSESAAAEIILRKKRELIDKAAHEAKKQLLGTQKDYYLGRLLEKAKGEIKIEKIFCRNEDISFFKNMSVSEKGIEGGLIAENKEGTISIDYSYETLLNSVKESNLQKIAEVLFK